MTLLARGIVVGIVAGLLLCDSVVFAQTFGKVTTVDDFLKGKPALRGMPPTFMVQRSDFLREEQEHFADGALAGAVAFGLSCPAPVYSSELEVYLRDIASPTDTTTQAILDS